MKRVPASELTRKELEELFNGGQNLNAMKSDLVHLGIQRIIEETLEAKIQEILGRGYYDHRQEGQKGHRNGYRMSHLDTGEGRINYAVPQLRGVENGELKKLRNRISGRSERLEDLSIEMYARGLSTRDIEKLWTDEQGRAMLSKSAVSELTERLWEEYEEFATRDLSDLQILYLFLDGIAEKLTPGFRREAVLCAWGIMEDGEKKLIHVAPGTKESTDCVKEFIEDMTRRGLRAPVMISTDGAPGLIRAVEECYPDSLRQRCLAHKIRNILGKLPEHAHDEFKAAARASYQATSVALARTLAEDVRERFYKDHPTAVMCFEEDFEACINQLRCPIGHRKAVRTTNLLERLFVEERRRMKIMPTISGERPVLKLMFAALVRGSERWKKLKVTEFELRQLNQLRIDLKKKENALPIKNKSSDSTLRKIYSKN
jgi:putative transposase